MPALDTIQYPESLKDVCGCGHIRKTHYGGPSHQCNTWGCKCEEFKKDEMGVVKSLSSPPAKVINYFVEQKEPLDFYVEKLKSITKEYPKDHPQNGASQGGYHFIDGDVLAIEYEFGKKMMDEIIASKPTQVVEIGTGRGYSTCWLMLGLLSNGKGSLITFDIELRNLHCNQLEIPGQFKMYIKDFKEISKEIPKNIDFVFHDGQHRFELITADLEKVIPHMTKKGQIWIHDAKDELARQLKIWFQDQGWKYEGIEESCGLGMAKWK